MIPAVRLGKSGLMVSNLCLGCMNFGESTSEADSIAILKAAYESGVFFWDTADVYSKGASERIVGQALKQIKDREHIIVATKVFGNMGAGPNDRSLSRQHIIQGVHASLKRLGTDYIDLYQMHRPDVTPIEESLQAMDMLIQQGKIRYFGTSTFAGWQMAEAELVAQMRGYVGPICDQSPYNILDRRIENARAGFLRKYGWGLIPWAPLAGGQLAGKYQSANLDELPAGSRVQRSATYQNRMNATSVAVAIKYVGICEQHQYDPVEAAIAWLLHQDIVTAPIIGPRTMAHFTSALPAATLELTPQFLQAVDELVPPGTAVADFHSPNVPWQIGRLGGVNR